MIQYNEKDKLADGYMMGHTIKEGDIIDLARNDKPLSDLKPNGSDAKWLGIDLNKWKYAPSKEDEEFYNKYKQQFERGKKLHGDKFVLIDYLDERS